MVSIPVKQTISAGVPAAEENHIMRRAMLLLTLAALLATAFAPAALAITGREALFGTGTPTGENGAPQVADSNGTAYTATGSSGQYPTLALGDKDGADSTAYIVFLQNRLIELGYLRDSADGAYGANTEEAVRSFQRNNGLPETGVADSATQEKLYSDISSLVAMTESAVSSGQLTRVQTMLGQWGFYGGAVDGMKGEGTDEGIRFFKAYMKSFDPGFGVTPSPEPTATPNPDGQFSDMPVVADQLLAAEVDYEHDETITDAVMDYVDGMRDFVIFRQVVQEGDRSDEALRVQTRLHQLKYCYGMDGVFGGVSVRALKYFQRKNGLEETGVADEETQKVLFSAKALSSEEYVFPYKLVVDISEQKVYVAQWTGEKYEGPIHTYVCATGKKDNPTPLGTYQAGGKAAGEWYYFKDFNCYAKWAYQIVGGILFHSNTMSQPKGKPSNSGLGHRASHGCIRMKVEDVKWIYDNCPPGTTVVIQE